MVLVNPLYTFRGGMQSRELRVLVFSVIFVWSSALKFRGLRGLQPAISVVHGPHHWQRQLSVSKTNQTFADYDDRLDLFGGGWSLKILLLKGGGQIEGDEQNSSADAGAGGRSGDSVTGQLELAELILRDRLRQGPPAVVQRILDFVKNISKQPNLTSRETVVTQFHTRSSEEGDGLIFRYPLMVFVGARAEYDVFCRNH